MPAIDPVPARREHFFVLSQGVRLEAELVLPEQGQGARPAVIFLPGSGARPFQDYIPRFFEDIIEAVFLPRDVCVLYVNKRGVGGSEGRWQKNSFQGRADDVFAAVRHLQNHPMIDPDRIGLIGHSQGGWIASLTASQHDEVAFFISLAGPTTTVEEQIRHTLENELGCKGRQGERLRRQVGWQMRLHRAGVALGRWLPFGDLGHLAMIFAYDPRAAIERVRCPGLFVFAELDSFVPPRENLLRFTEILGDAPPENLSTVVIPAADHLFHLTDSVCFDWEQSIRSPYSEEVVPVLSDWLSKHGY